MVNVVDVESELSIRGLVVTQKPFDVSEDSDLVRLSLNGESGAERSYPRDMKDVWIALASAYMLLIWGAL